MRTIDKILESCYSTVIRVHSLEVSSGIRAIDASTSRIDRHEPNDIDTKLAQVSEFGLGSSKGSGTCKATHVHLIDDAVLRAHSCGVIHIEHLWRTRSDHIATRRAVVVGVGDGIGTIGRNPDIDIIAVAEILHQVKLTTIVIVVDNPIGASACVINLGHIEHIPKLIIKDFGRVIMLSGPTSTQVVAVFPHIDAIVAPTQVAVNIDHWRCVVIAQEHIVDCGNVGRSDCVVVVHIGIGRMGVVVVQQHVVECCYVGGSDSAIAIDIAIDCSIANV